MVIAIVNPTYLLAAILPLIMVLMVVLMRLVAYGKDPKKTKIILRIVAISLIGAVILIEIALRYHK